MTDPAASPPPDPGPRDPLSPPLEAEQPDPLPHLGPVDHVGIAVADLEAAKRLYGEAFGLRLVFEEEVASERVRVAAYDGGGMKLELLASTDPDGPIGRFLARRGEGIHHICYRVDDVAAMLAKLRAQGIRTLDEAPRPGAGGCQVAFIHPKSAGGVLVELSQPGAGGSVHE